MHNDLVLMPEVDARRALSGRIRSFSVLAPLGKIAGKGTLRVLRVRPVAGEEPRRVDVICGYESYVGVDVG